MESSKSKIWTGYYLTSEAEHLAIARAPTQELQPAAAAITFAIYISVLKSRQDMKAHIDAITEVLRWTSRLLLRS
jgi:hypothetical protein